jgi:hypothetical protein
VADLLERFDLTVDANARLGRYRHADRRRAQLQRFGPVAECEVTQRDGGAGDRPEDDCAGLIEEAPSGRRPGQA